MSLITEQAEASKRGTVRVTLLAHAPTAAQRDVRFPDDADASEPIESELARRVLAEIPRWDRCVRGPEPRVAHTADGLGIDSTSSDDLRAWQLGSWTGASLADLAAREPTALHAWRTDPAAVPHGGESLLGFVDRLAAWLQSVATPNDERTFERTLVVADSSVIRAVIVAALELPPTAIWRFDIAPLSITVVQRRDGMWRARVIGARPRVRS